MSRNYVVVRRASYILPKFLAKKYIVLILYFPSKYIACTIHDILLLPLIFNQHLYIFKFNQHLPYSFLIELSNLCNRCNILICFEKIGIKNSSLLVYFVQHIEFDKLVYCMQYYALKSKTGNIYLKAIC